MTRNKRTLYLSSIAVFVSLFLTLFVPYRASMYLTAAILTVSAVLIYVFVKKRAIPSINKSQILLVLAVAGLVYAMIYTLSGLYFSFVPNPNKLSVSTFIQSILPISVIIISIEIIRNVILAQEDKATKIISYFFSVLAEILIFTSIRRIESFNSFMDFMALYFLPSVMSNLLYHYLSKRYGAVPNIVYRLITTLFTYLIPVWPYVPDAFVSIYKLLVPILLFAFIDPFFEKKKRYALKKKSGKASYVFACIAAALMISIVMLISCRFQYGALVIGSGSMTGELNKGDVTVYEQFDDQIIQEGQVIVFEENNVKVIHRVVKIERINGELRYYTKGDANEHNDVGYRLNGDIIGLARLRVPYVGYPTIWLRDAVSKAL